MKLLLITIIFLNSCISRNDEYRGDRKVDKLSDSEVLSLMKKYYDLRNAKNPLPETNFFERHLKEDQTHLKNIRVVESGVATNFTQNEKIERFRMLLKKDPDKYWIE